LLQKHAADDVETHLLAAELYMRQDKLLLVLKALKRAVAIATNEHPAVHLAVVQLATAGMSLFC